VSSRRRPTKRCWVNCPSTTPKEAKEGKISVEPDIAPLAELVGLLDTFNIWFNIVEP
jgi:alkyl sulfatase BDS1-like metallo-beta-lactamase superfamily hydrolase